MNASFADLVENVRLCSLDEKSELLHLLQRDLIEARREEFAASSIAARTEVTDGRLRFSSSLVELKNSLNTP